MPPMQPVAGTSYSAAALRGVGAHPAPVMGVPATAPGLPAGYVQLQQQGAATPPLGGQLPPLHSTAVRTGHQWGPAQPVPLPLQQQLGPVLTPVHVHQAPVGAPAASAGESFAAPSGATSTTAMGLAALPQQQEQQRQLGQQHAGAVAQQLQSFDPYHGAADSSGSTEGTGDSSMKGILVDVVVHEPQR